MIGMGGFGVEMTNNVILGGVKSVTIHDETNYQVNDLSSYVWFNVFSSFFELYNY